MSCNADRGLMIVSRNPRLGCIELKNAEPKPMQRLSLHLCIASVGKRYGERVG